MPAPSSARVVWTQGLFLQPQHFQQQERYLEGQIDRRMQAALPHAWGFLSLAIDVGALELGSVAIAEARGILPDGTPFAIPNVDDLPAPLAITEEMRGETIVLALPLRGVAPVEMSFEAPDGASAARYAVHELEVRDHALDGEPALMQVGRPAFQLLRSADAAGAHTFVAVARIVERNVNGRVVLDDAMVPPLLATRANGWMASIARDLLGTLRQRGDAVAEQLAHPGRGGVAEVVDYLYLQALNRHEPVFAQLAGDPQLHPAVLHDACLRLAGDVACYGAQGRRPISYPPYRHADPEATFRPLVLDIRRMLAWEPDRRAVPIEIQDRRHGFRVAVFHDTGLAEGTELILAVTAQVPQRQLLASFPDESKVGPIERIQELVQYNLPGIPLVPLPVAPRQLPYLAGYSYFRLDRTPAGMWDEIARAGGLALHVPDKYPGTALELWAVRS